VSRSLPLAGDLVRLYENGTNIVQHLVSAGIAKTDAIAIAYDVQAGSYVDGVTHPEWAELHARCCRRFASVLDEMAPTSLLEVGVGEATTLADVVALLRGPVPHLSGVDLSTSRLVVARSYLADCGLDAALAAADIGRLPFADRSVDVVVTSHSLEPNGGREAELLSELCRVAARYVVLREPSDEIGDAPTIAHIERHGYVRGLLRTARSLGANVVRFEPWGIDPNPSNRAALIVISTGDDRPEGEPRLVAPLSHEPLVLIEPNVLYASEEGRAYPIVAGVPQLIAEKATLCVHHPALYRSFVPDQRTS
jgi:uncharacterized protein YbaR (Trm112 family)